MTASSFLLQRDYFSPPPPITECCVYGTAPAGGGGGGSGGSSGGGGGAAAPLCYPTYEEEEGSGVLTPLDQVGGQGKTPETIKRLGGGERKQNLMPSRKQNLMPSSF